MMYRGFAYKLDPTEDQIATMRHFSGVCRLIYNLAWEQRRDWWRQYEGSSDTKLNYIAQARELTALRAEYDWIAAVSQTCQQQALRDLDRAFANFFAGRAKYPTPRQRGVHDSFRFQGREVEFKRLNAKWSMVRLPKIGWVRYRDTRPALGLVKNVTVSCAADGWRISFACEIESDEPSVSPLPSVGIDRGIAATLALSTGQLLCLPDSLGKLERGQRSAQRILARRKRGSARHAKQKRRCSRLAARRARIRKDWHHKRALEIAKTYGVVVMEELNVRPMTASAKGTAEQPGRGVAAKSGLNRSILNQGWTIFQTILRYKLNERGGALVTVNPAYTSQTCSDCGVIDKQSRESQARFACRHCGFQTNADHNAALNILRRNTASMRVEERQWPSDETRTRGAEIRLENPAIAGGC